MLIFNLKVGVIVSSYEIAYDFHSVRKCFCYRKEQEFLLVSARQEILRYNLVDPGAGLRPLPIPNLKMVIALDFDMKNNCIYWSDINESNLGIKVSITYLSSGREGS